MVKSTGIKKLIAVLAMLAMVLTLLPATAFAESLNIASCVLDTSGDDAYVDVSGSLSLGGGNVTVMAVRADSELTSVPANISNDNIVYINQTKAASNGNFSFRFKVRDTVATGDYITVFFGGTDVAQSQYRTLELVSAPTHTPGDVNDDESVDDKDIIRLTQYVAGWDVTINEPAADVNADESVDDKDIIRLTQYVAGWDVTLE